MKHSDIRSVFETRCPFELEQLVGAGYRVLAVGNDRCGALYVLGHPLKASEIDGVKAAALRRSSLRRKEARSLRARCRAVFQRLAASIRGRSFGSPRPAGSCWQPK